MGTAIEQVVGTRDASVGRVDVPGDPELREALRRAGWRSERIAGREFWVRPGRLGCYSLHDAAAAQRRQVAP